jgi:biotin carboxyl carrier protein
VLASQALGEPVTQMTMNTFHGGGTSSNATIGLPRVEQILNLSEDNNNEAVLAKISGKVTKIEPGAKGTFDTVYINNSPHHIPHNEIGESQPIKVKVGDTVTKGDFLTYGDLEDMKEKSDIVFTNASPKLLFKLKDDELGQEEALRYTQDYLTNSMEYAFENTIGGGKIDRRHLETIIGKMTSLAKIVDAGDSNYMIGATVNKNQLDRWNAEHAGPYSSIRIPVANAGQALGKISAETYKDRKGSVIISKGSEVTRDMLGKLMVAGHKEIKVVPRPIKYQVELNSKETVATKGHDNWLSNLGHQDVFEQIARGATFGQTDKLEDARARLMSGKLINTGDGFNVPKQKANSISSRMLNFFQGMK